ncbi:hypothetical protein DFP73DRAFT_592126 [Morchella snyderi]|nr:hypothetical protein DFP73DRAFT_592126 [Morchella snyderi]
MAFSSFSDPALDPAASSSVPDFASDPALFSDPPPTQDAIQPTLDELPSPKKSPFKLRRPRANLESCDKGSPRVKLESHKTSVDNRVSPLFESHETTVDDQEMPRVKLEMPEATIDTRISPLWVQGPRVEPKTPEGTVDPNLKRTQTGSVSLKLAFILKFGNDSFDSLDDRLMLYESWAWPPDADKMDRVHALDSMYYKWKSGFMDIKMMRRYLELEERRYCGLKRLVTRFEEIGWKILETRAVTLGLSDHLMGALIMGKFAWSHCRAAELERRGY